MDFKNTPFQRPSSTTTSTTHAPVNRPPITFPPPPPNETPEQRKKRQGEEREAFIKDLVERKYPELRQEGVGMKNPEVSRRVQEVRAKHNIDEDTTDKVQLAPLNIAPDDPRIFETNPDAAKMVANQLVYYVQMAHKARSPKANVPWVRFIGCETSDTARQKPSFGEYLVSELRTQREQRLTTIRINRAQPFMVCLDEQHQFDAGTDKRIKRLLGLYRENFDQERTKFQQHRKSGLTEDEHKTRSSFFAREVAWREAKKRHDAKENERKKDDEGEAGAAGSSEPKPPGHYERQEAVRNQTASEAIYLRNHTFPPSLKQEQYNFVVISYFRDLLAFERVFRDLSLSTSDADFQPILIAWAFTETSEEADKFKQLTQCNHPFLQKNLYVVDLYKWIPLDSENLNNIPITYANKYQNEIMNHRDSNERFTQEYHQWERERYGEEAEFEPIPVQK